MSERETKPGPLNRNASEIALACAMGGEVEDELAELLQSIAARICRTVRIARESGKYPPFGWTGETSFHQIESAWKHIEAYWRKRMPNAVQDTRNEGGEACAEDELAHAVTRLAILCALLDREGMQPDEQGPQNAG